MSRKKKSLLICLAILVVIVVVFFVYVSDYYKKDALATEVLQNQNVQNFGSYTLFKANTNENTLIFYPGAKVEGLAYAPLLNALSENGINTILVNMPFNLAVFGANKASGAFELLEETKNWYIGGHSLGGAMASNYYNNNTGKFKGLILLGAYGNTQGNVIEIYGSNDEVLSKEKLSTNAIAITGGNHAYFGNYGEQSGDGVATISRQEQQEATLKLIKEFMTQNY